MPQHDASDLGPPRSDLIGQCRQPGDDLLGPGLVVDVGHARGALGVVADGATEDHGGAAPRSTHPLGGHGHVERRIGQRDPIGDIGGGNEHTPMVVGAAAHSMGTTTTLAAVPFDDDPSNDGLDDGSGPDHLGDDHPGDDPGDDHGFGAPLPPDDRLWRHPSEIAGGAPAPGIGLPSVHSPTDRPARRAPDSRHLVLATVAMVIGVAAVLSGLALSGALDSQRADVVASGAAEGPGAAIYDRFRADIEPSIVRVSVDAPNTDGPLTEAESTDATNADTISTGLVVRADGHILTSADAVDGARAITVTTSDGIAYNARIIGIDEADDLAVIDIDREGMAVLPIAKVGSITRSTRTADDLLIVAHRRDRDRPWVGIGTIDASGVELDTISGPTMYGMVHATIESTEPAPTAIAFDTDGTVVGLTTMRRSGTAPRVIERMVRIPFSDRGLTSVWSTPIGYAMKVADDLIDLGRVARPTIGVTSIDASAMPRFPVGEITADDAASPMVDRSDERVDDGAASTESPTDGIVIIGVAIDGPADLAGIRAGDLITAIDDAPVHDTGDLVVAIRDLDPGRTIDLHLRRNGIDLTITVAPIA